MAELAKDASIEAVIAHTKLVHVLILIGLGLRDSFNMLIESTSLPSCSVHSRRTFVVNNTNNLMEAKYW